MIQQMNSTTRCRFSPVLLLLLLAALIFSACAAPGYYPAAPASESAASPAGGAASAPESGGVIEYGSAPAESSTEAPAAGEEAAAEEAPAAESPAIEYSAPASAGDAGDSAESAAPAGDRDHSAPRPERENQRSYEPVTAGVVDDNEQWSEYLDFRARNGYLWVNDRDVSERILIHVWDENRQPVHDALVQIYGQQQNVIFEGRTDAGGRLLFHPRALDGQSRYGQQSQYPNSYEVVARKGYVAQRQRFDRYQDRWSLELTDPPAPGQTRLDLLFLVDATGSMSDEIDKLKSSMADVAAQIDSLPERPSVRYGLVSYRDRGDAYRVRLHPFTSHLSRFQRDLSRLRAGGGGDYPESLNEALHRSLNEMDWTDSDAVRLIVLVADAPPHLDYNEPFSYDTDMFQAVRQGIKILPVGASGLDEQGEYIYRQLAQFTGGKFVFLTYEDGENPASGPGTETSRDVENYSVDTLDRLVVRLVREELAKLPHSSRQ